jgi:hypothetical protein
MYHLVLHMRKRTGIKQFEHATEVAQAMRRTQRSVIRQLANSSTVVIFSTLRHLFFELFPHSGLDKVFQEDDNLDSKRYTVISTVTDNRLKKITAYVSEDGITTFDYSIAICKPEWYTQ